jgi:hypothetical protein
MWDTKSGKAISHVVLPRRNDVFGLSFWDEDHLLAFDTGQTKVSILDAKTGTELGVVRTDGNGKFGTSAASGKLWAVYAPLIGPGAKLFAFPAPAEFNGGKGLRYSLGPDGLR